MNIFELLLLIFSFSVWCLTLIGYLKAIQIEKWWNDFVYFIIATICLILIISHVGGVI